MGVRVTNILPAAVLLLFCLPVSACGDLFGPGPFGGDTLYLLSTDSRAILELDLETGDIRPRLSLGGAVYGRGKRPARSVYYALRDGAGQPGGNEVVRVDLCSMTVPWRQGIDGVDEPSVFDGGFRVAAHFNITPSLDGDLVLLGPSWRDGIRGIVALDVAEREPVGFAGPFYYASARMVPPTATYPEGLVAISADRDLDSAHGVYLFHPRTLDLLDSIPPGSFGLTSIGVKAVHPDGEALYLTTPALSQLLRYDLRSRSIVSQYTGGFRIGDLRITPDGELLMLSEFTDLYEWGSGLLRLLDAGLEPVGEIDLSIRPEQEPRTPDALRVATTRISNDGTTGYAMIGIYDKSVGSWDVVAVDLETRQVVTSLELDLPQSTSIMVPPDCD